MKQEHTSVATSADVLLGVAFVVLKLCHVIDWSWAWVLSPFWIPLVLVFAITTIWFLYRVCAALGG